MVGHPSPSGAESALPPPANISSMAVAGRTIFPETTWSHNVDLLVGMQVNVTAPATALAPDTKRLGSAVYHILVLCHIDDGGISPSDRDAYLQRETMTCAFVPWNAKALMPWWPTPEKSAPEASAETAETAGAGRRGATGRSPPAFRVSLTINLFKALRC